MKIQCLGAVGTVTGSRYVVEAGGKRILVDCGLFQGIKALRQRNWLPFSIPPDSIDAVLLTHAHIDHSGYLPVLVKSGFGGKIYCTRATADLCAILLPDAAHLQEEDAKHANRHGYSKHKPALPLFDVADAERALARFEPIASGTPWHLGGVHARFTPAGHILGAASINLWDEKTSVLFSGDLGRASDPLVGGPAPNEGADILVVESTYGNRKHGESDPKAQLAQVINDTAARSGVVVIPAFAVGRAQLLLYYIHQLKTEHRIADLPVYLNSPMAASVLRVFDEHRGEYRLSNAEADSVVATARIVASVEESKALSGRGGPMVIIAGSGMATGGRVVHHLEELAPDARNTILLVGFQAAGTRGAKLLEGDEEITIHGRDVPLRAKVVAMDQLSAHADYSEILAWLRTFTKRPRTTLITHGEPAAADALRHHIERALGWECVVPVQEQAFEFA